MNITVTPSLPPLSPSQAHSPQHWPNVELPAVGVSRRCIDLFVLLVSVKEHILNRGRHTILMGLRGATSLIWMQGESEGSGKCGVWRDVTPGRQLYTSRSLDNFPFRVTLIPAWGILTKHHGPLDDMLL